MSENNLLIAQEENEDTENAPLLGRYFEEIEEDALPPRPSALEEDESISHQESSQPLEGDESIDVIEDRAMPIQGRMYFDDENEGLPPRRSALDEIEQNKTSNLSNNTIIGQVQDSVPVSNENGRVKSTTIPKVKESSNVKISTIYHTEHLLDLEEELNFKGRTLVTDEEMDKQRNIEELQGHNRINGRDLIKEEEFGDSILVKRSELFDRLEKNEDSSKK